MTDNGQEVPKYTQFMVNGQKTAVEYVETTDVKEGVVCDVYRFTGDSTKDLAIVTVQPIFSTPRQQVLKGSRTIEGYLEGQGTLMVRTKSNGTIGYEFDPTRTNTSPIEVKIGEEMQWTAGDTGLKFYEICEPPYEDGRFENLPE